MAKIVSIKSRADHQKNALRIRGLFSDTLNPSDILTEMTKIEETGALYEKAKNLTIMVNKLAEKDNPHLQNLLNDIETKLKEMETIYKIVSKRAEQFGLKD